MGRAKSAIEPGGATPPPAADVSKGPATVVGESSKPNAIVPYDTKIVEYSETAKALAELQRDYGGVLYPVQTAKGMADAKAARWRFVKLRTGLDAAHKQVKADILERTKLIDGEKRAILAIIEPLEKGLADQIDAEEKRVRDEQMAKEQAERDRVAAEEKARKDAEEKELAEKREALSKQQAELDAQRAAQEAQARQAREAIEKEQREARAQIEAAQEAARSKAQALEMSRQAIMGIQQQTIIAQQGRLGVRVGGTVECIEATLKETEDWPINAEQFGDMMPQAQQAKDHTVATIRGMLETARRQQAEDQRLKEERARVEAAQSEARKAKEEADRRAADDLAAKARAEATAKAEAEMKARAEQQARELAEQRAREEAERVKRQQEAEAKAKADAEERERQRVAQELLDGDAILVSFRDRFGKVAKYSGVIKAIDKLKGD